MGCPRARTLSKTTCGRAGASGIPLVAGAVAFVLRQLIVLVSSRWPTVRIDLSGRVSIPVIAAMVVALEINQQLHAPFLMGS